MKKTWSLIIFVGLGVASVSAQNDLARRGLPFLNERDTKVLDAQAEAYYKVVDPIAARVGKYAVQVKMGNRQLAMGTVTAAGVVTKWSEIQKVQRGLEILGSDGVRRGVKVKAVYKDYDLAVLSYIGDLDAVDFETAASPGVGSFLVLAGPGNAAIGFGVVSVAPRSLREEDKAFLGVRMGAGTLAGGGVRLQTVEPESAAERGGLKAGDVVKTINGREVHGLLEMGNVLQKMKPGEMIQIQIERGGDVLEKKVTLGARPNLKRINPARMNRMRTMGGNVNAVAEGFPDVMQSDMQIKKNKSGGPVFDLDGKFVGIVVARSSRIKTYIIPADKLAAELAGKPDFTAAEQGAQ